MSKETLNGILLGGFFLIAIVIVVAIVSSVSAPVGVSREFAECVGNSGATMYGAYWCPHCNEQKLEFGDNWKYVGYVECAVDDSNERAQACLESDITAYPTWIFGDGSRETGKLSLEHIAEVTGCELETE